MNVGLLAWPTWGRAKWVWTGPFDIRTSHDPPGRAFWRRADPKFVHRESPKRQKHCAQGEKMRAVMSRVDSWFVFAWTVGYVERNWKVKLENSEEESIDSLTNQIRLRVVKGNGVVFCSYPKRVVRVMHFRFAERPTRRPRARQDPLLLPRRFALLQATLRYWPQRRTHHFH